MIQWEKCTLREATHIEIGGEVHQITEKDGIVERSADFGWVDILVAENIYAQIPKEAFSLLDIRCLRKFKPKPIEFEATFASYDGNWRPLYSLDDRFPDNCKKAKFKCVEILEDEE